MSLDNLKNMLNRQNISWNKVEDYLKKNNANQAILDSAKSIFNSIDKDNSGTIDKKEWSKIDEILTAADSDSNGQISSDELQKSSGDNIFKAFGDKVTNTFLNAMSNSEEADTITDDKNKKTDNTDFDNYEKDSSGNVITYPKERESFKMTAERLGFKAGTPEYQEFLNANSQAGKRKWFKVGEQVKIPPSLLDKTNKAEILDKKAGQTEVENYIKNHANNAVIDSKKGTPPRKSNNDGGSDGNLPDGIKTRIEALKKSGDKYEVIKNSNGTYDIKVSDGAYMKKNSIGEIEIKYDSAGNIASYVQKYNNGKITETTYTGGKKTTIKANPAPQLYQDIAAQIRKETGANARIEYDNKLKKYTIIETNLKDKDIKEIRIVADDKSWQQKNSSTDAAEKGLSDAWDTFSFRKFNVKEAINAGMRNKDSKATKEDYFLSQTITYTNGKIIEGTYKEGKIKKQKQIQEAASMETPKTPKGAEAANSALTIKDRTKINSATDISFNMPADAPENAKEFANSLVENKEKLMRELNIDSDTYNMLAQTAMGIAKQETNFGEMTGRQVLKNGLRIPSDTIARAQNILGVDNESIISDWSQGITQCKYTLHTQDPWVKEKMENLGITNETQLQDNQTSAVATMVVLAKLNKEIDAKSYQEGIKTAQGIKVGYEGWSMGEDGIARKTGKTESWTNEISRQDVLCAFWNGGGRASVKNGTFKPQIWSYSRNVRKYTQQYKLNEDPASRKIAEAKVEATKPFAEQNTNNGDIGGVVFLPAMYTDKNKHLNTPSEIEQLKTTLTQKGIEPNLRNMLISAMQNGELGFDFGLRKEEMDALTAADIKLLLKHLNSIKTTVNSDSSINTADGISTQEAAKLRSQYGSKIGNAENEFREEYMNNHSKTYNVSAANPKVLRETSTVSGTDNYVGVNGQRRGFKHETARGVNVNTTNGQISSENKALATAADQVVKQNPNNTKSGNCLQGVKDAMKNAGIDISDMTQYGNTPKYIKNWFAAHPEMFTPVEYVSTGDGTARTINSSDLAALPAGYIVIWQPESSGNYSEQAGHIAITNGNGQGYSDATDNLGWGTYSNNKTESGKGEHGKFIVYKLSDNWETDASGKLKWK